MESSAFIVGGIVMVGVMAVAISVLNEGSPFNEKLKKALNFDEEPEDLVSNGGRSKKGSRKYKS